MTSISRLGAASSTPVDVIMMLRRHLCDISRRIPYPNWCTIEVCALYVALIAQATTMQDQAANIAASIISRMFVDPRPIALII